MNDSTAGADRSALRESAFLAPAERLFDALIDPARRTRTVACLLVGFVILWALYGLLANWAEDVHPDVAEALLWSREPGLQHHPPMLAWVYKVWYALFPITDWASYLLVATTTGVTLWIVWVLLGDWLDDRKRVFGLATLTLVPLYTFHAAKLNANTVMFPFWAAVTLYFLRSFRSCARLEAALAGLAGAGAVLAKYWSLYLVAGFGLAALMSSGRARYFRSPAPWISIGLGVVLLTPHVITLVNNPRALDFLVSTGVEAGVGGALLGSARYLVASLAYVSVPILALIATQPGRAALADVLAPATAERRLAAAALWLPLVLPALANIVAPHRLTALWTTPNWSLLPVVLFASPLVIVERKHAVRTLAVAIVFPVLAVLAAPVVTLVRHSTGATDENARFSLVAAAINRAWRDATAKPLRWIGGSQGLFYRSVYYTPPSARFLALDGSPAAAAAIARDGVVLVCPASNSTCVAQIDAQGGGANSRRSEVELARRYLGITGQRERFVIVIIPPP